MMPEIVLPLLSFALAASITPGPNNIMVTASGANFGYRRSIPHMLGITFGFTFMIAAIGFGLGQVFAAWPVLHSILQIAGSGYLVFLAWKIARSSRPKEGAADAHPMTFMQAALFQWVNPKAWMMAVAALTAFTSGTAGFGFEAGVVAAAFLVVSYPSISVWCLFGTAIGRLLQTERALRIFNWTMAALIVASIAILYT